MKPHTTSSSHSHGMNSVKKVMTKDGYIAGYELSNGKVVSVDEAVEMANNGKISGVVVAKMPSGGECLRSTPDKTSGNNISSLPHQEM